MIMELTTLVERARAGDLDAFGRLVAATQTMAYAVARGVLRDAGLAQDATQEAYLRAFRQLGTLREPAGFLVWFRRIVVTVALNVKRQHRACLLTLDDVGDVPILDEQETTWTEAQRRRLASALVGLTPEERRWCDRRYHGRWTTARLAAACGVAEPVMRKRLQRVRDKLRREIEMAEQRVIPAGELRQDWPETIVELLARPRLTDLPEHPVGDILDRLRALFPDCAPIELPEVVDFAEARTTIGDDALYVDPTELHRLDDRRILRYDLTLPLLLTLQAGGRPLRVFAAGKAYRRGQVDAMHLEAFHQAEVFCLEDRRVLDARQMTGRVIESAETLLPGRALRITRRDYTMCREAWELDVDDDGRWLELMAWGVFTDKIVRHVGGDPAVHTAVGIGCGLDRFAMLRYGIDDIRKIEAARVA
jgi:RNA polymerase sigma-70 factor, ECF subfamily